MSEAIYFPPLQNDTWETVTPAAAGWNAARLDEAIAFVGARNSTGLVVLWRGRILAEHYWGSGGQAVRGDIASAQKSITAALVGIAQQSGMLDIDSPSSTILGERWSATTPDHEAQISIRHHLTMTTGLTETLTVSAAPGQEWAYTNRTYHLLKNGLERVAARPLDEWSQRVLWGPLGMHRTSWVVRVAPTGVARNVFAFGPEDAPFSALLTTVRDMARFGLLMSNLGVWDDRAVLTDADFVRASISSSQQLNPAYGYLWWLNAPGPYIRPIRTPVASGPLVPAAPPDLFCALGFGDQKIYVSRSLGLVIARQGFAADEPSATQSRFDDEFWTRLMAAAPIGTT